MNPKQVSAYKEINLEIERLISYVNDRVVPEVRHTSSHALRFAAEQLSHLAEHLDRGGRRVMTSPTPATGGTEDGAH